LDDFDTLATSFNLVITQKKKTRKLFKLSKLGRIKASVMFERTCIRVLSPSNEPPVLDDEGSTASTASLPSFAIILCPKFGFDLLTTVIIYNL